MRPLPELASGCPGSVFVIETGSFLDKMAVPATQQARVSPNDSGHRTDAYHMTSCPKCSNTAKGTVRSALDRQVRC
jgi:hypothetical protein